MSNPSEYNQKPCFHLPVISAILFIEFILHEGGRHWQETERFGKFLKANPRSRTQVSISGGFLETAKCPSLTCSCCGMISAIPMPINISKAFRGTPIAG